MSAIATLVGVVLPFIVSCGPLGNELETPRLETPGWEVRFGFVLARRDEATGDLLLWHLRTEQIESVATKGNEPWTDFSRISGTISATYRYESKNKKLVSATFEDWKHATGTVTDSGGMTNVPPRLARGFLLHADERANVYEFTFDGKKVATRGAAPFRAIRSPDRQYVAVLSVNGPAATVGGPILGGELTYTGPFNHELFSQKDGAKVGEAITLDGSKNAEYVMMVWSADGKQLVYFDQKHRYLWVVDTPMNPPADASNGNGAEESVKDSEPSAGKDKK